MTRPIVTDPLLLDVPERIETARLVLRAPRRGDGPAVNAAVLETLDALAPWMPWAQSPPTLDESESHVRRQAAKFVLREDLVYFVFERRPDGSEGELLGGSGLHRMDWTSRRFEIGYWRRAGSEGRGVMTEAVLALSRMAFDALSARRVEIRMDDANERSWKLAERAGFTLEAVLRFDAQTPRGEPRSTRVYARVRGAEEPIG